MVLPSEFVHVIESGGLDQFTRFRDLCEKGRDSKIHTFPKLVFQHF